MNAAIARVLAGYVKTIPAWLGQMNSAASAAPACPVNVRKALCDLADDYKLPGVAPEIAQEARNAAKQVIAGVLQNSKPFN